MVARTIRCASHALDRMAPSRCIGSPVRLRRPAAALKSFGRAEVLIQGLAASIHDSALRDMFLQTRSVREVLTRSAVI